MTEKEKAGEKDASVSSIVGNAADALGAAVSRKIHPLVEQYAQLFTHGARTPILRYPDEYGMEYEDIFFPSLDGVTLEGWFIPAESDRLLIINHPMPCNRYGFPGHLAPWNTMFGGFEVNFLPELKHLHDAGYNIITYDIRNHGRSGVGSGGLSGIGLLEYRDVVGSVRYAKSRPDTASMRVGVYSRCMGANSTIIAVAKWPHEFEHIEAFFFHHPAPGRMLVEATSRKMHLDPGKTAEEVSERIYELSGFRLDQMTPTPYAHAVTKPTMMSQLERDWMISKQDMQELFDNIGATDKEMFWIDGSDQRFSGYNYYGNHPEKLVGWFDRHMGTMRV